MDDDWKETKKSSIEQDLIEGETKYIIDLDFSKHPYVVQSSLPIEGIEGI